MSTDRLIEQAARHSIYIQRAAGYLANLFDPYTLQLQRELKILLSDMPTTQNIRRVNRLIAEYRRTQIAIYTDYNDDILISELRKFAVLESEWEIASLSSVINSPSISLVAPSPTQVWAAINSTPLIFPDSNDVSMLGAFIKDWQTGQINKVNDIIRTGFITGKTTQQIVQEVAGKNGYLDNQNTKSIKTMVRTATNHVSNIARQRTYEENDDIVIGYEIIATLDSRTSNICRGYDGVIVKNKDKIKPMPPFHPNCVLEGTIVTTCSDVNTLYKRAYKGLIIDIITKSGRKLSITPNHPILTRTGWKDAKLVDNSDQLATVPDDVLISDDYKNSVKAEVSDLFGAANVSVEPSFIANRPTTPENFHGDGANGEVSVININSLAWGRIKSTLNKKVVDNRFGSRKFINSALNSFRSLYKRTFSDLSSSAGFVSGTGICAPFLKSHIVHSYLLLLRWASKLTKSRGKNSCNRRFRTVQAEVLGDSPDSYSSFISFDDVISVDVRESDSCAHVYNLENKDNWYLSSGIITHNCRTGTAPVLDGRYAIDESSAKRASSGVSGGKQVSAKTTYYDWLRNQGQQGAKGRAFVTDVLGKERGDLFLNGGLSVSKFKTLTLDEHFQPIPLDKLKQKQSLQLAFDAID